MSLILEALKKLERERESSGRGFLVVAHTPWRAARGRAGRWVLMAMAVGALAGGAAWIVWTALSSRVPAAPAEARTMSAVRAPAASALPPPIWESPAATASTGPARRSVVATPARVSTGPPADAPASAAPVATPEEPPVLVITPSQPRAPPASAAPLRLEAISSQDGEPVAVINGRLVRKGESIDGALITWIGADAVEVEVAGRRRVLGF